MYGVRTDGDQMNKNIPLSFMTDKTNIRDCDLGSDDNLNTKLQLRQRQSVGKILVEVGPCST